MKKKCWEKSQNWAISSVVMEIHEMNPITGIIFTFARFLVPCYMIEIWNNVNEQSTDHHSDLDWTVNKSQRNSLLLPLFI